MPCCFTSLWLLILPLVTSVCVVLLLALPVYPQNAQCALHFKEFLLGYKPRETIQVKFPYGDSTRRLADFSVGFCDGFTKVIIMVSILLFINKLDTW